MEELHSNPSKGILGRHRKTGEDLAPLLPGVPSIHLRNKVSRSFLMDGELGITGELRLLWKDLKKNSMDLRDNHVHSVGRVEGFALVVQKLTWECLY